MAPWKVFAIVFVGVMTLVGGGCAALLATAGTFELSKITLGGDIHLHFPNLQLPDFAPKATKAELAEAATTVPPTHSDCVAYQRVADAGTTVGELNFADPTRFDAYRTRVSHVLYVYDVDLRAAITHAQGPLRTHLTKAERAVATGLVQIDRATTSRQYDVFDQAANGYTELSIAQQLLLGHCGRGVEPDVNKAFNAMTRSTARATTTTRPS